MQTITAQFVKNFQYLFIPHELNNHRAKLLHIQSFLLAIAAILLFNFGTDLVSSKLKVLGYAANISPQAVVEITNTKRQDGWEQKFNDESFHII